jgi:molybdopterin-containing oxidoreductase family iron-sulfur binding subunit
VVELTVDGRGLEIPVWVVPGHADGALTLHLGYGRDFAGRVAAGAGVNACAVRAAAAPWRVARGVAVRALGRRRRLASTQDHHSMEGRHIVLGDRFDNYLEHPEAYKPHLHVDPSLTLMPQDEFVYDGNNWGMSVDLTACTGCNACVVACQAENNVPVVGKDQVAKGREMHWIRIDRYYQGVDADRVEAVLHQPVLCMHCEQAPCEVVCPVAATVHSADGLNDMIYNRCVGTRYCSNNCPYKVRRFNFLLYQDWETPSLQLGRNPDVTVRSRGVMEKCTYCVQRISRARIAAKMEDREIRDGEVVTACQQACPSDALVFGDMNDPGSAVARAKASPLDYSLLEELGTRPHTTFLARIRNPNPRLEPPPRQPDHGAHA